MLYKKAKDKYLELFDTEKSKAEAFDKIAEKYYCSNFGSTSKSDFEVLMFSIYIEQILKKSEDDYRTYSDYTLSKLLGITQTRVSSLKVKKELIYPYEGFDWRNSFLRIADKAIYEDKRIKLYVPDKNLYLEIKNAIENNYGYVDIQLTPNLLQVRLPYFLDLLVAISDEKSRDKIRKDIKHKIKKDNADVEVMEKEPFGKALLNKTPEIILSIITDCIPVFGGVVKTIGENIISAIKKE